MIAGWCRSPSARAAARVQVVQAGLGRDLFQSDYRGCVDSVIRSLALPSKVFEGWVEVFLGTSELQSHVSNFAKASGIAPSRKPSSEESPSGKQAL